MNHAGSLVRSFSILKLEEVSERWSGNMVARLQQVDAASWHGSMPDETISLKLHTTDYTPFNGSPIPLINYLYLILYSYVPMYNK